MNNQWYKFLLSEGSENYFVLNVGVILRAFAKDQEFLENLRTIFHLDKISPNDSISVISEELMLRLGKEPATNPLVSKRIVKVLGSGSFGMVFETEDGLAIKLYWGAYSAKSPTNDEYLALPSHLHRYLDTSADIERHEQSKEKIWSGDADVGLPNIISQGKFQFRDRFLYWVMMSKFEETLQDKIDAFMNSLPNDERYDLDEHLNKIFDSPSKYVYTDPEESMNFVLEYFNKIKTRHAKRPYLIKELEDLISISVKVRKEIQKMEDQGLKTSDVRPGNIGLVGNNPVFFDL
jgi:hypothetical protein